MDDNKLDKELSDKVKEIMDKNSVQTMVDKIVNETIVLMESQKFNESNNYQKEINSKKR